MQNCRNELVQLEHRFWLSGADFYRENLSKRCLMVVPGVGQMTREAVIEGIAGGDRWSSVELSDVQFRELSDDGALLIYDAAAARESMEEPYRAHVSSVYVRGDRGWKLAFHQQTIAG